ncbi:hypothetical protein KIN20_020789 [Parelaphostrongylus tenuis]|uniref:Uncharacterized protein n=1 Tax=Parelaphostrongylus tenuis TaxID=148309 RepID=A0AAD5MMZ5_PARTN|nr:hypothetical protein KIN20_020789 [Parelaphostrongylus tenuis]
MKKIHSTKERYDLGGQARYFMAYEFKSISNCFLMTTNLCRHKNSKLCQYYFTQMHPYQIEMRFNPTTLFRHPNANPCQQFSHNCYPMRYLRVQTVPTSR